MDVKWLKDNALSKWQQREGISGYKLPGGKVLNVLAEGRLVNLAGGNGHPAEIIDMSFSVQALAAEWLTKHKGAVETRLYDIPAEIDEQIPWAKLASLDLSIDTLTLE